MSGAASTSLSHNGATMRIARIMKTVLLVVGLTSALVLSSPVSACFSCSGSNPHGVGKHSSARNNDNANRGAVMTRSGKKVKQPGKFTSREQGDNKANNRCSCSKGGKSSRGKTGGDMGY